MRTEEEDKSLKDLLGKLRPGDHIASGRLGDLFEHHGIYIGEINKVHMVTHFKAPIKDYLTISGLQPVARCNVCGYEPPQDGGRVTSCMNDCFSLGGKIFIIKYKVPVPCYSLSDEKLMAGRIFQGYRSDKLHLELYKGDKLFGHINILSEMGDKKWQADTQIQLSMLHSCRSPEEVLEAAKSDRYTGKYNFLFNNCEDFVVYCMTGKERSIQVEKKLHTGPYKVGKTLHLFTDRRKLKDKFKQKVLRFLEL